MKPCFTTDEIATYMSFASHTEIGTKFQEHISVCEECRKRMRLLEQKNLKKQPDAFHVEVSEMTDRLKKSFRSFGNEINSAISDIQVLLRAGLTPENIEEICVSLDGIKKQFEWDENESD